MQTNKDVISECQSVNVRPVCERMVVITVQQITALPFWETVDPLPVDFQNPW